MTVGAVAFARVVKNTLAALNRGSVGLRVLERQHIGGNVVDFAGSQRRDCVQVVGMRSRKGRHMREVPPAGITGADPVEDHVLDLGDPTRTVEPVVIGEIRHSQRRIALHPRPMTGHAMLGISRRTPRHRIAEEPRIAGNGIRRDHEEAGAQSTRLCDQDARDNWNE
jgi:hypothetical protein